MTRLLLAGFLIFFSANVWSVQCAAVFPDAASSFDNNGEIDFFPGSRLLNINGDNVLATDSVNIRNQNARPRTCDPSQCVASGNPSAAINSVSFQASPSNNNFNLANDQSATITHGNYGNVRLRARSNLTISGAGVTRIDQLRVDNDATLVLSEGVYWIDNIDWRDRVNIRIDPNESVVIYTNNLVMRQDSRLNFTNNSSRTEGQLLLVSFGDIDFRARARVNGFFYAAGSFELRSDASLNGAVNAQDVELRNRSTITFRPDAFSSLNGDQACDGGASLPALIGHWDMNVCGITGTSNEIIDVTGTNNATARAGVTTQDDGRYCQAANFRGQQDNIIIDHINDYALDSGTLAFWFRTPDLQFAQGDRDDGMALLSKDSTNFDAGGHLTLWVSESGSIRVRHQSASASAEFTTASLITENTWHHLVYTFGSSGMNLYIDGLLQGSNSSFTEGIAANPEPIILGASAVLSGDSQANTSELFDFFQGDLDEVRLYDSAFDSNQVSDLFNLANGVCTTCSSNPDLLSHWQLDLCFLNGLNGDIIDTESGFNGRSVGSSSISENGQFCSAIQFDGASGHAFIPHVNDFELNQGTFSLWVNPDALPSSQVGLLSKDANGFGNGDHLSILLEPTGLITVIHQATNGANSYTVTSNEAILAGQWNHISFSWNSTQTQLHVNGRPTATTFTSLDINQNQEPLIFGASAQNTQSNAALPADLSGFFDGRIDDVRLFEDALTTADVQGLLNDSGYQCEACAPRDLVAFYRFEEANFTGTDSINDSSGNSNDASPLGSVSSLLPSNNISCRALAVPEQNADSADAIDTGIDINDVGNQGTISFWYRSNVNWSGGNDRQLFDASSAVNNARPNADDVYFFAVLRNNSELRFGFENVNDFDFLLDSERLNFSANQWVHLAFTWNTSANSAQLFVNGELEAQRTDTRLQNNALADLSTLYFGDNRTRYIVSGATRRSANGVFDDIRVYNYVQTEAEIQSDIAETTQCNPVNYYLINHPSQALTCENAQITLTACSDAAPSCTPYDQPVTVSVPNPQGGRQTLNFTGSTNVQIDQDEEGTLVLDILSLNAQSTPLQPTLCNGNCSINFVDAGFVFYDASSTFTTPLPDLIAESNLNRIGLRAVESNQGVCGAALQGTQDVDIAYDCVTDGASYSSNICRVPFAGIEVDAGGAGLSSGQLSLTFDSQGRATLNGFSYADAGRLQLFASGEFDGASITSGSAGSTFDSIPASLRITSGSSTTLANVAGEPFSLNVQALGAQNSVLPNYEPAQLQHAFTRLVPDVVSAYEATLTLSATASVPSSENSDFSDTPTIIFSNGEYITNDARLSEAGEYQLDFQDNGYLGANTVSANATMLGRFRPAYFTVTKNTPRLADSCDGFTYVAQPFAFDVGSEPIFTVEAKNADGITTQFYDSSQWRLSPSDAAIASAVSLINTSSYSEALTPNFSLANVALSDNDNYDGIATLSLLNIQAQYAKTATPAADLSPFNTTFSVNVNASFFTDTDGTCFQSSYPNGCEGVTIPNVGNTQQRYGRINLINTFGPETRNLRVPIVSEYLVNGAWVTNSQDSCTSINFSQASNQFSVANASTGSAGQVSISSQYTTLTSTGALTNGFSDLNDLVLARPVDIAGNPVRGALRLFLEPDAANAQWADYLNIDWNLDGNIDENDKPDALVSFGLFRGNDRLLNWREQR